MSKYVAVTRARGDCNNLSGIKEIKHGTSYSSSPEYKNQAEEILCDFIGKNARGLGLLFQLLRRSGRV